MGEGFYSATLSALIKFGRRVCDTVLAMIWGDNEITGKE
jgi:hypothetical protein